jgi:hypothetical protein
MNSRQALTIAQRHTEEADRFAEARLIGAGF